MRLGPKGRLVLGLFARRMGLTFEQFQRCDMGLDPWPPGYEEAIAEEFLPLASLTSGTERTNIRDKMQVQTAPRGRKVGRPLDADHPFTAWLKAQDITVTEWALEHQDPDTGRPYKRERVKSWFAEGTGARPIPRSAADVIAKEAGIAATKRNWRNGIRE